MAAPIAVGTVDWFDDILAASSRNDRGADCASTGRDVGCQTVAEPCPVPVPLQYPLNLIYAQNMLAITVSQIHQVDLNVAQLRLYLREHYLQQQYRPHQERSSSSAAARLQTPLGVPAAAAGAPAQASQSPPVANRAAAAAQQPPQPQGGADAAAPAGDAARRQNAIDMLRRRLLVAVRVAVLLIVMEVRIAWCMVCFVMSFLYVAGVFDPLVNWFQRAPEQGTLEQQLAAFRRRRDAVESQASAPAAPAEGDAASAAAAARTPTGTNPGQPQPQQQQGSPGSGSTDTATGPVNAPSSSSAAPAATNAADSTAAEGDGQAAEAAAPAAPAGGPTYRMRFFYQLVVMFFLTLLPWWNPDPRYL
mmetsp:Transcript_67177/g.160899  ORF Transcript_67177/g.160899 Transcript_67177/m.160899 type:complete len:362 (+) Transcript_67177:65-1150(+)